MSDFVGSKVTGVVILWDVRKIVEMARENRSLVPDNFVFIVLAIFVTDSTSPCSSSKKSNTSPDQHTDLSPRGWAFYMGAPPTVRSPEKKLLAYPIPTWNLSLNSQLHQCPSTLHFFSFPCTTSLELFRCPLSSSSIWQPSFKIHDLSIQWTHFLV